MATEDRRMRKLLPLMLLAAAAPVQAQEPQTYLVSIVDVPIQAGESIEDFSFATWGATFEAVCHIPRGWTIRAGGSATPEGVLSGEGSHGATWLREESPPELRDLALVTLEGPVQAEAVSSPDGDGEVPATFEGKATISNGLEDREIALTAANVRLVPAARCPDQ